MRLANLDVDCRGGMLVASIGGEIDLSNAGAIRSALLREMHNELLGLVLDLTDVDYLDSTGIHIIYDLRDQLETRGQGMRLVVPEVSFIGRTLDLVDASSVVGIVRTAESGLAELSGR
jgi:anti-sigma B factor antagonist